MAYSYKVEGGGTPLSSFRSIGKEAAAKALEAAKDGIVPQPKYAGEIARVGEQPQKTVNQMWDEAELPYQEAPDKSNKTFNPKGIAKEAAMGIVSGAAKEIFENDSN